MSGKTKVEKLYYENGKLKHETPYHRDQRHGMAKWWYKSGQLQREIPYHQGQRHGITKWWRKDGQVEYELYYLYNEQVTEEEYRKHELVESLACLVKQK